MALTYYRVYVDGKSYQGEDIENTYDANYGGGGWHITNHGSANHLIFDDRPARFLCGWTGLRGALERIERYRNHGLITFKTIEVVASIEGEDVAECACGYMAETIRPGKYQCAMCEENEHAE